MAFWLLFFTYVGSFLLSELLRPKPNIENARPAGEDEFDFPTASEGRHVPIVVGKVQIGGPNVIWYGDIEASPIQEKVKTGLFSKKTVTTGYEYFAAIQMALCRGPIIEITKVWHGEKIVFDRYGSPTAGMIGSPEKDILIEENSLFGGQDRAGGINGRLEVFEGVTDAAVSTFLSSRTVPTPNYQNTAYVIWRDGAPVNSQGSGTVKSGGYIGNSPSVKPFKFEVTRYPHNLDLGSGGAHIIGEDANPIEFLYEILTDTDWGLGINPSQINLTGTLEEGGFNAVALQVASEGLGFSAAFESPKTARELIAEIERHVDGYFRLNVQTGLFEIVLARSPAISPDGSVAVDESNIMELINFSRGTWSETENEIRVTFTDRAKNYSESHALAQDMANRLVQGRSPVQLRYPGLKTASTANIIAWRELRSMAFPLAKIKFTANRTLYLLQAGDVISFSWVAYGLTDMKMRVTRVGYGTDKDERITIDAVEDIYDIETAAFVDPPATGWIPPVTAAVALAADEQRLWQLPLALMSDGRDSDTQQVGTLAVRPTSLHIGYRIIRGPVGSAVESDYATTSETAAFTPSGTLVTALEKYDGRPGFGGSPDTLTIRYEGATLADVLQSAQFSDLDSEIVNLFLIDDEVFFFETVTTGSPGGTYVLSGVRRGMLHTTPQTHAAGARLWFFTYGIGILEEDETASLTAGETGSVKFLPQTPIEEVAFADAIRMDIGDETDDLDATYLEYLTAYPPNNLRLYGKPFPDFGFAGGSPVNNAPADLSFLWRTRNRETQVLGDVGLDVDQETINLTAEDGLQIQIEILRADRSPAERVYYRDDIPVTIQDGTPHEAIFKVLSPLWFDGALPSPLFSPETQFIKDFEIAITSRDTNASGQYTSQEWRETIHIVGYGLGYGESYGGVFTQGTTYAQGQGQIPADKEYLLSAKFGVNNQGFIPGRTMEFHFTDSGELIEIYREPQSVVGNTIGADLMYYEVRDSATGELLKRIFVSYSEYTNGTIIPDDVVFDAATNRMYWTGRAGGTNGGDVTVVFNKTNVVESTDLVFQLDGSINRRFAGLAFHSTNLYGASVNDFVTQESTLVQLSITDVSVSNEWDAFPGRRAWELRSDGTNMWALTRDTSDNKTSRMNRIDLTASPMVDFDFTVGNYAYEFEEYGDNIYVVEFATPGSDGVLRQYSKSTGTATGKVWTVAYENMSGLTSASLIYHYLIRDGYYLSVGRGSGITESDNPVFVLDLRNDTIVEEL